MFLVWRPVKSFLTWPLPGLTGISACGQNSHTDRLFAPSGSCIAQIGQLKSSFRLSECTGVSPRLEGRLGLLERGTYENDSVLIAEDGEEAVTVFRVMQRNGV